MAEQPPSRIGAAFSITAAGLLAAGAVTLALGVELGFVFLTLSFALGLIGLAITTIELLAGYRGSPQKTSLILGAIACVLPVFYFLAVVGSSEAGS